MGDQNIVQVFMLHQLGGVGGGKNLSHTTQLRCRKCSFKTTNQCSKCKPTYAICLGRYGIDLFVKHYEEKNE